jgi:hypothetical protein
VAGRNNFEIALTLGIARETVKQTLWRPSNALTTPEPAPLPTCGGADPAHTR